MGTCFIISDHHLLHHRMYKYTNNTGERVRPWAENAPEADEMMIEAHNSVVRQGDTTYFVGDVAIHKRGLDLLPRMNGRKVLIRGNHDIFRMKQYAPHFADIRGSHKLNRMILTHYPIHPNSIPHWCLANVHGHTHANDVTKMGADGYSIPDNRYYNACVESAGIIPKSVEQVEQEILARTESVHSPSRKWVNRILENIGRSLLSLSMRE